MIIYNTFYCKHLSRDPRTLYRDKLPFLNKHRAKYKQTQEPVYKHGYWACSSECIMGVSVGNTPPY